MTMPDTVTTAQAARILQLACTLGVSPSREAIEELIAKTRLPHHREEAEDSESTVIMAGVETRTQPSRH